MSKPMLLSDRVPVPPSVQASVVEGLSIAIDAVAARAAPSHRFLRYGWYAAALSAYGGRAKTLVVAEVPVDRAPSRRPRARDQRVRGQAVLDRVPP